MNLLDPWACDAARSLLKRGNPLGAAELLLDFAWKKHRAVRQALGECQDRLVHDAEQLLADGCFPAARDLLTQAERCGPLNPQGLRLRDRIARSQEPTVTAEPPPLDPAPPHPLRDLRFALGTEALVVTADIVRLGLAGCLPVEIPVAAPLHRQHAMFTRHRGRYWLLPFPHHRDLVAVNGAAAESPRLLESGDELTCGAAGGGVRCRFTFRQTRGSLTAILQTHEHPVVLPDGRTFQRIVLLDDRLVIRPSEPADLVFPKLPCDELRFERSPAGLEAVADGGRLWLVQDDEYHDLPKPLVLPCDLVAEAPLDIPRQLVNALTDLAPLSLPLHLREA